MSHVIDPSENISKVSPKSGIFALDVGGRLNTSNSTKEFFLPSDSPSISPEKEANLKRMLAKMPLQFIENKGQVDKRVKFYAKSGGTTIWFTADEIVFDFLRAKKSADDNTKEDKNFRHHKLDRMGKFAHEKRDFERQVVRMKVKDANLNPIVTGRHKHATSFNYFRGNDSSRWQTNITTYSEVYYKDIYAGIDLRFYSKNGGMEYDFIVNPGANPRSIAVALEGIEGMDLDVKGDLIIKTTFGEMRQKTPHIFQKVAGQTVEIEGGFKVVQGTTPQAALKARGNLGKLSSTYTYAFNVAAYDKRSPLTIDPSVIYSTYLGGSGVEYGFGMDEGYSIAVDSLGNAYVTGITSSSDFPKVNAIYPNLWGYRDAFVFKINSSGSQVIYSTYLGGSGDEWGYGIAVDSSGNAYVTGYTDSSDFPTVNAQYPDLRGSSDAFVFKINSSGSQVIYSTYLGGSGDECGYGIAVDNSGNAYVTGQTSSSDFPKVNAIYQNLWGPRDAFVFKINSSGSQVIYSTYLGGSGDEYGYGIAVDSSGNAYVTGATTSTDFPTVNAIYPNLRGASDAFVFKINSTGSQVIYSTYLGGSSHDQGKSIAVDSSGNAYVTGMTSSSDFPKVNAIYPNLWGYRDAFVFKINSSGSQVIYSTYLGGSGDDGGNSITVDSSGNAYVTGTTYSPDFPTVNAIYPNLWGPDDAFVVKIAGALFGHASVSSLSVDPQPVTLGQNLTLNFNLTEANGYSKTFQNIAAAILTSDGRTLFDCGTFDNITISANGTWSNSATCQIWPTQPTGIYKAIIRGRVTGGNWFDFDNTGSGTNPISFQAVTASQLPATISGKVKDVNNNPVSQATVYLGSISQPGVETITDSKGNFKLYGAVGNSYALSAKKSGICNGGADAISGTLPVTASLAQSQNHILAVQCYDTAKAPVIIIPGIMGSTLVTQTDTCKLSSNSGCYPKMDNESNKQPSSNYKILSPNLSGTVFWNEDDMAGSAALKNVLEGAGYHVEFLPWDWRVPTDEAAGFYLKSKIDDMKKTLNVNYVNVVAHSQGGLVTRAYIQGLAKKDGQSVAYGNDINQFIMLGTPNGGAANPYWMFEGGDPMAIDNLGGWSSLISMFYSETTNRLYKLYYNRDAIGFGGVNDYKVSRADLMSFYWTKVEGGKSLMAKDPLICDGCSNTGQDKTAYFNSGGRYPWLHDALNDTSSDGFKLMGKLGEAGKVQTHLMLSINKETIDKIHVKENVCFHSTGLTCSGLDSDPDVYLNVNEYGVPYKQDKVAGDGTVSADRAKAVLGSNITISEIDNAGEHSGLMKSLAQCVVNSLENNSTCALAARAVQPAKPLLAAANASVPNLHISVNGRPQPYLINPAGLASGIDVVSGDLIQDIPETELILLEGASSISTDDPANGAYTLRLKGVTPDTYEVSIEYIDENYVSAEQTIRGIYDDGEVVTVNFTLNGSAQQIIQMTPPVSTPANLQSSDNNGVTQLTWNAGEGAAEYRVYGRSADSVMFRLLGTTTSTQFETQIPWDADRSGEHWLFVVVSVSAVGGKGFYDSSIENRPLLSLPAACPNPDVRRSGIYYSEISDAYASAADGDIILGRAVTMNGSIDLNKNVQIDLRGGYACDYSSNFGITIILGTLSISSGMVTVENIVIQ